ncbi:uncharacterized protein BKA78DRAFT_349786 [Phyllosticta capitalensis]|uniref:uncharacterized protein n=1 Tax=Phyllosticta capitalensis TaxID=121624 RepID=UPI00312F53A6
MPEQLRFTSLNDMEYPECMTLECELSKWRQLDNEAIKLITNTLPGWMANLLSPEQRATSKALFDELQARYGKHDDDETMEDWLDLFWDGSADMSDFLDEWTKRLAKCLEAGIVISEVWQIYQLACINLPLNEAVVEINQSHSLNADTLPEDRSLGKNRSPTVALSTSSSPPAFLVVRINPTSVYKLGAHLKDHTPHAITLETPQPPLRIDTCLEEVPIAHHKSTSTMPKTSITEKNDVERKSWTSISRIFSLRSGLGSLRNSLRGSVYGSLHTNDDGSVKESGSVKTKAEKKHTDNEAMIFTPDRMVLASEEQRLPLTRKELEENPKKVEQKKAKKEEKAKKNEEKATKKAKKKEEKAEKKKGKVSEKEEKWAKKSRMFQEGLKRMEQERVKKKEERTKTKEEKARRISMTKDKGREVERLPPTQQESAHNFGAWRQCMEHLLRRAKLWDHVNDHTPPPKQPGPSAYDSFPEFEEACKPYDEWHKTEQKVERLVRMSVGFPGGIRPGLTAHAIWSGLVGFYGQQWDGIHFPSFLEDWHAAMMKFRSTRVGIDERDKIQTFVNIVKKCGNSRFEDWATQALSDKQSRRMYAMKLPQLNEIEDGLEILWESERHKWRDGAGRIGGGSCCLQAEGPYREPVPW